MLSEAVLILSGCRHPQSFSAMADAPSQLRRICVRRYAAGKAFVCTYGAPRVDANRFRALMRAEGIPDAAIEEYLDHAVVDDEAWLQDVYPA
jgi:hypothetical protein